MANTSGRNMSEQHLTNKNIVHEFGIKRYLRKKTFHYTNVDVIIA